ncbi:RDD family protein, partial [Vibrio hyugaensis]|uniref:RDD family protein n=1 Tax=Vibrio hyugaensis TaxID=1534743 RepID=UPI0011B09520
LILTAILIVVYTIVSLVFSKVEHEGYLLVGVLTSMFYYRHFWSSRGFSIGEKFVGIKVINEKTGKNLTKREATSRFFTFLLSGLIFNLGYIWMLFDSKKRCWHDSLEGVIVIEENE